jgi:DNA mismatch repair ATPase MutS
MDATISLGVIANEMNCTRPDIVEEAVVIIKAGRHPLQVLYHIFPY